LQVCWPVPGLAAHAFSSASFNLSITSVEYDLKASRFQTFVASFIGSVEQLEILCLLSQAPARWWTPKEVLHVVRSSAPSVRDCLEMYVKKGLMVSDSGSYRYQPRLPELEICVCELSQAYSECRVAVIEMIYAKPNERVQDAAKPFRFRTGK
jgi:hypothetical protein